MTEKTFLPDYGAINFGTRYRAAYKLFADEPWRMISKKKVPVFYATAAEAIQAAKERVKQILNAQIRAEVMDDPEPDILGVEDWKRERAEQAEAERKKAFGDDAAKIIFAKGGRQVTVQRKRRRV